ncbi:LOW QUALITY PROTEIN: hypothetical protein Cgig2_020649 [Carnegiea gigantea]|uniref:DUF4283 domain-containing protein n=1 Tax=Carnegiea gigantea TaxID=171969 RepID=A0A9Q1JYR5_9CARY|nr:LOW QUALITY PROTEIN: hypothetical protein Cgig2_020649 [Carnegiea gigantea]
MPNGTMLSKSPSPLASKIQNLVPIKGPFSKYVEFFNEHGQLIRQQVVFEWIPSKCAHCNMLGHTTKICKKKPGTRKEWRPIQKIPTTAQEDTSPTAMAPESNSDDTTTTLRSIHSYGQKISFQPYPRTPPTTLWLDLNNISHSMEDAWCLMGDFNTIQFKEDRIGGNEVQDHDLKELASPLETYELHELKSIGAYYSWTNKAIWS